VSTPAELRRADRSLRRVFQWRRQRAYRARRYGGRIL